MIVVMSTTKGYVVGVATTHPAKVWKAPDTLRTEAELPPMQRKRHLARIRRWMRLTHAYAN